MYNNYKETNLLCGFIYWYMYYLCLKSQHFLKLILYHKIELFNVIVIGEALSISYKLWRVILICLFLILLNEIFLDSKKINK